MFGKAYVVGKDILKKDITEFYWTLSASTFPPHFQRFLFFTEDGRPFFYHEKRQGTVFPLTEEHATVTGTVELTDEDWTAFFDCIKDGEVRSRTEHLDSGGKGPWTYLYWKKDPGDVQEFSFSSAGSAIAFEELCGQLKKRKGIPGVRTKKTAAQGNEVKKSRLRAVIERILGGGK